MPEIILISVIAFLVYMSSHILIVRIWGVKQFIQISFYLMIACLFLMAAYFKLNEQEGLIVSLFVFLSFWMFYIVLMSNLIRSVSLRLMGELADTVNNKISISDVGSVYSYDEMVEPRIESMIDNCILKKNSRYKLTGFGKLFVLIFGLFRALFNIKQYG